jgi:hypothetical protein
MTRKQTPLHFTSLHFSEEQEQELEVYLLLLRKGG